MLSFGVTVRRTAYQEEVPEEVLGPDHNVGVTVVFLVCLGPRKVSSVNECDMVQVCENKCPCSYSPAPSPGGR